MADAELVMELARVGGCENAPGMNGAARGLSVGKFRQGRGKAAMGRAGVARPSVTIAKWVDRYIPELLKYMSLDVVEVAWVRTESKESAERTAERGGNGGG